MPSSPVPLPSQTELKLLHRYLHKYHQHVRGEQPLAAEIIQSILGWVRDDIEPKLGQNSYNPKYE